MGRDPVALGLGIFAFVLVCVIGVQFMLNKEVIDLHEGFSSASSASSSVTRAADCNCLPGYIASNSGGEYDGKVYLAPLGPNRIPQPAYIPNGTSDIYVIDPVGWWGGGAVTCNLIQAFDGKTNDEFASYYMNYFSKLNFPPLPFTSTESNFKGVLTCDVVKKTGGKNYFCQNLGDPTKTRSCY